jgi:CBS domain-containing protein
MTTPLDRLRSLRVADVMSRRVVSVSAAQSMDEAAETFVRSEVSGAPVVDDMGRCSGMLSALDFVKRRAPSGARAGVSSWDERVEGHMTPAVQSIKASAPLAEAARIMAIAHVHRLPVLDDQARPQGMITALDVVSALVHAVDEADDEAGRADRRRFEREIKQEHAELHRRIQEVRGLLGGRGGDEGPAGALLRLCREAKQHFENEERGGYFAEALARAPGLADQAQKLQAEHAELYSRLRELAEAARGNRLAEDLREQFEPLARQWLRHEADENRLLLAAYTQDTSAAD